MSKQHDRSMDPIYFPIPDPEPEFPRWLSLLGGALTFIAFIGVMYFLLLIGAALDV